MNIFEQSTKKRLRFKSPIGDIGVEDLWQLPLQSKSDKANLDDIAKSVARELKTTEEESFVNKTSSSPINELRLKVLKHIIASKIEDAEKLKDAEARRQRKEKLLTALDKKQDGAIEEMSEDEIKKELDDLG